jgi:hypothetical protein
MSATAVTGDHDRRGDSRQRCAGLVDEFRRAGGTLPAESFWATGAGHQIVLVVPSLNLIAIRYGEESGSQHEAHGTGTRRFGPGSSIR